MNITLHISASQSLLDSLSEIVAALKNIEMLPDEEAPTPNAIVKTPASEVRMTPPAYTIEQLRELTVQQAQAGKRDAIKALLTSLGVAKVTDLPETAFAEYYAKASAL